jgi:hypothetical protein
MSGPRKVHVLFHDAGGGHRNAAVALKAVCEQQSRPWKINLVQFQDLTDHLLFGFSTNRWLRFWQIIGASIPRTY